MTGKPRTGALNLTLTLPLGLHGPDETRAAPDARAAFEESIVVAETAAG